MRIRDFAAFVSALCLLAGAAAAQDGPVKVGVGGCPLVKKAELK